MQTSTSRNATEIERKATEARARMALIGRIGRGTALAGAFLPLFLIGILKFTQIEVEAVKPLVEGTPWLAWLIALFGDAGASYFLGVFEISAALLLLLSIKWPVAGIIGGAAAALTFFLTSSILLALPIWEDGSGGFPWLNGLGSFLIKDVGLLGVALVVLSESLLRFQQERKA